MELSKIYSGKTRNFNITVLDNQFYSERVSQLKRWGIKFEQVDILDEDNLQKHIKDADLIYHLAGITDVGTTIEDVDKKRDKKVRTIGIKGTQNIIKYSSDESKILTASDDKTAKIWDRSTGECKQTFSGHGGVIWSAIFSA